MKTRLKPLSLLAAATICTIALASCSDKPSSQIEETTVKLPQYSIQTDYSSQFEYYEALIAELQAELLNEKAEGYQSEHEYKEALAKLEAKLAELTERLEAQATPTPPNSQLPEKETTAIPAPETAPEKPAESVPYIYKEEKGSITITAYVGTDTDVAVPSSINGIPVTAIGESAFAGTNVKKVSLPNSVTHIDWFAFNSCAALTELIIPSSVSLIDYGAIDNCPRVIVICERGSYAEKYAKSRAIPTVTK